MQLSIQIFTPTPPVVALYDITRQVKAIVSESGVLSGMVKAYVQGAGAGVMILFI